MASRNGMRQRCLWTVRVAFGRRALPVPPALMTGEAARDGECYCTTTIRHVLRQNRGDGVPGPCRPEQLPHSASDARQIGGGLN